MTRPSKRSPSPGHPDSGWGEHICACLAEMDFAVSAPARQSASLFDGYSGVALVFAGSGDPADREITHRLIARAAQARPHADGGLLLGLPSVGLAARLAARAPGDYAKLLRSAGDATVRAAQRLLDSEDERLAAGRAGVPMRHFDVCYGLTGLARLLLADPARRPTLEHTLRYLVRLTEPVTPADRAVPGWWTPDPAVLADPVATPHGHLNPGLAHGIAGPLALLALSSLSGVEVAGQRAAATRIAEWLLDRRGEDDYGPFWPTVIPLECEERGSVHELSPSRVAWCYGAPGIARALQLAARAYGEPAWEHAGLATLGAALSRPWETTGIRDPSLCHGSAGVLHIVNLVARDAASPVGFRTSELHDHLSTFADFGSRFGVRTTPPDRAGFLEGAAGVALALRGAGPVTEKLTWDAALMLS
ncbi:lanthionine synthetase C family protein [Streptomyces sp. NPDC059467]|uniref:lanthionine synthetase C family protein n=1 Tax=Streptomyces sp. NPDC059467 TaxID=3346844 RepID=UPI0036A090E7